MSTLNKAQKKNTAKKLSRIPHNQKRMAKTKKDYAPAKPGFSFGRLETFLLVLDAGSIGNAARKAGKKQSLFSKQIGEIEAHFKTKLGIRTPHGFKPTANGKRLAELA